MLEKNIQFQNGQPVDAFLSMVELIPMHTNKVLEFIMVLEGSLEIRQGYQSEILNDGDVFVFNPPDLHCISSLSKSNYVLTIYVDLDYLEKFCPTIKQMSFWCDCNTQKGSNLELLRHMLSDLYFRFHETHDSPDWLDEPLDRLVQLLLDNFLLFRWQPDGKDNYVYGCPSNFQMNSFHLARIHRVENYIYHHYDENITLGSLANQEYLSPYYLSHFIKQVTGLSFQQWLSSVRAEFTEKLLVSSTKNISEIAEDVGFSSTKYLIAHFKKWYGTTPSKYREETSSFHSHLPHKYYVCDRKKAERLLNNYRYESAHSGKVAQEGIQLSGTLEKSQIPQIFELVKLKHFYNLLLRSGEIYQNMSEVLNECDLPEPSVESLAIEFGKLPGDGPNSYEDFLLAFQHYMDSQHHKQKIE
jgi:AraC-like DNA-binding protein